MGVFGLHTFIRKTDGAKRPIDLAQKAANKKASGLKPILLIDYSCFIRDFSRRVLLASINSGCQSKFAKFYGCHIGELTKEISKFVLALRSLGIEPVFVTDPPKTFQPGKSVKSDTIDKRYLNELNSFQEWQHICNGYRSSHQAVIIHNPLAEIASLQVLAHLRVKVVFCENCEADDAIISLCQSTEGLLGVLTGDTDFVIAEKCRVLLFDLFDIENTIGYRDGFIVTDLDAASKSLKCEYTDRNILAASLQLNPDQMLSLALLCGNDYTRHLNRKYRISHKLGIIGAHSVQIIADWLNKKECSLKELPEFKDFLLSCPQYEDALQYSQKMYSGLLTDVRELSPVENETNLFQKHANDLLTKSKCYWRTLLSEDLTLKENFAIDLTLPLRRVLYTILGCGKIKEYGLCENAYTDYLFDKISIPALLNTTEDQFSQSFASQLVISKAMHLLSLLVNPTKETVKKSVSISNIKDIKIENLTESDFFHSALILGMLGYIHFLNSEKLVKKAFNPKEIEVVFIALLSAAAGMPPLFFAEHPPIRAITLSSLLSSASITLYQIITAMSLERIQPKIEEFFDPGHLVPFYVAMTSGTTGKLAAIQSLKDDIMQLPAAKEIIAVVLNKLGCPLDLPRILPTINKVFMLISQIKDLIASQKQNLLALQTPPKIQEIIEVELFNENLDDELEEFYGSSSGVAVVPATEKKPAESNKKGKSSKSPELLITELPIMRHRQQILDIIEKHKVTVLEGKTGSGKSTKVSQFILEDAKKRDTVDSCSIIVTQPRRIATVNLAKRVANELGQEVGSTVGYRIGGERKGIKKTKITYATAGYLMKLLGGSPESIKDFSHIVLDEVHERSVDADFLCLTVRNLLAKYHCNTKVVLMSATLEGDLYANYFKQKNFSVSNPYCVEGRQYQVTEMFLDHLAKGDHCSFVGTTTGLENQKLQHARKTCKDDLVKKCFQIVKEQKDMRAKAERSRQTNISKANSKRPKYFDNQLKATDCRIPICCSIIISMASLGEAVLVFLPGLEEILSMYDYLDHTLSLYGLKNTFSVFLIHSQLPLSDQKEALEEPMQDVVHVLLSTAIAESSLTVPKLRLVINFCLKREVIFKARKEMSCLERVWCSKASCSQRAGRAGRVFSGVAVHLVTKDFYSSEFPDYDIPEMVKSPLTKVFLQAKVLGRWLKFPVPSKLLRETLSPPDHLQLKYAIKELFHSGAIAAPRESADMTLFGKFSLELPIDIRLAKLVYFGICFGVPVNAIIMAAGLSLRQDVFSLPLKAVMKDEHKYRDALWKSSATRWYFDAGQYSEPHMYQNLFYEWIKYCKDKSHISRQELIREFVSKDSRHAGISKDRLLEMESKVCDIANHTLGFIPQGGPMYDNVEMLTKIREEVKGSLIPNKATLDYQERIQQFFASFDLNDVMLKALITLAFNQNLLYGESDYKDDTRFGRETEGILKEAKDEERIDLTLPNTLYLNPMKHAGKRDWQRSETIPLTKDNIGEIVNFISNRTNHQGLECKIDFIGRSENTAVITISDISTDNTREFPRFSCHSSKVVKAKNTLTPDIIVLWQYCQRHSLWAINKFQRLPRPHHPCLPAWYHIAKERSYVLVQGIRNPVAVACDSKEEAPLYGIATSFLGSHTGSLLLASGICMLPRYDVDQKLSARPLLMILAFQTFHRSVKILRDETNHKHFKAVYFEGQEMVFPSNDSLTVEDIARINTLRKVLSNAIPSGKTNKIPLHEVETVYNLVRMVIERDSHINICQSTESEGNGNSSSIADERLSSSEDSNLYSDTDSEDESSNSDHAEHLITLSKYTPHFTRGDPYFPEFNGVLPPGTFVEAKESSFVHPSPVTIKPLRDLRPSYEQPKKDARKRFGLQNHIYKNRTGLFRAYDGKVLQPKEESRFSLGTSGYTVSPDPSTDEDDEADIYVRLKLKKLSRSALKDSSLWPHRTVCALAMKILLLSHRKEECEISLNKLKNNSIFLPRTNVKNKVLIILFKGLPRVFKIMTQIGQSQGKTKDIVKFKKDDPNLKTNEEKKHVLQWLKEFNEYLDQDKIKKLHNDFLIERRNAGSRDQDVHQKSGGLTSEAKSTNPYSLPSKQSSKSKIGSKPILTKETTSLTEEYCVDIKTYKWRFLKITEIIRSILISNGSAMPLSSFMFVLKTDRESPFLGIITESAIESFLKCASQYVRLSDSDIALNGPANEGPTATAVTKYKTWEKSNKRHLKPFLFPKESNEETQAPSSLCGKQNSTSTAATSQSEGSDLPITDSRKSNVTVPSEDESSFKSSQLKQSIVQKR